MPCEIHRAVRGIDIVHHWKGSEFATFLNYLGPGVFKHILQKAHYQMFLNLFCASTICATGQHRILLPVAKILYKTFISQHLDLLKTITSNVHNLIHIPDECERFGDLTTLSACPFENFLYKLKLMLRSGHLPLAQIANRLIELSHLNVKRSQCPNEYPLMSKTMNSDPTKFLSVKLREGLTLKVNSSDKWFYTNQKEIVAMEFVEQIGVRGVQLLNFESAFIYPIDSTFLNIYKTKKISDVASSKIYKLSDIFCKFVVTHFCGETFFVPLQHTYNYKILIKTVITLLYKFFATLIFTLSNIKFHTII